MPDYLQQWLPVGWIGAAVALLLSAAWLWRTLLGPMFSKVAATLRLAGDFLDDWQGEPKRPGVDAVPGVMERLANYDERIHGMTTALEEAKELAAKHDVAIADIQYHVQPNHGGSAWDEMSRKVDGVAKQVDGVANAQVFVVGTVEGMATTVSGLRGEVQQLRSDHSGRITRLEEHEDSD